MIRRHIIIGSAIALASAATGAVSPAQAATLKQQVVGTWTLESVLNRTVDGKVQPGFGGNAKGVITFEASGRFTQIILGGARQRFAANDRTKGTAEENQAAVAGTLAMFGTWTVDEKTKVLTLKISSASYPNWDGTEQVRPVTKITADEMDWHNPGASSGGTAELVWRRAK